MRQRKRANLLNLFRDLAFQKRIQQDIRPKLESTREQSVSTLPVSSDETLDDYEGAEIVGESSQATYQARELAIGI